MKRQTIRGALSVVFLVVCATSAQADGWSLSKLNPFAKKPTTPARTWNTPKKESSSFWKLPSFKMPGYNPVPKRRPTNQPSTWSKIGTGAKNMYNKTVDVLTPWDNKPKPRTACSSYTRAPKKKSFFSLPDWLKPAPEPKRPKPTVSGFLSQPRPKLP